MELAAEKNHPSALGHLGWAYSEGILVPKDDAKALAFCRRGAEQGDLYSIRFVGWAYRNGVGCEQDYVQARGWYERAAEQNDEESLVALGIFHEYAQGLPKDMAKAAGLYYRASELGNADAKCRLGWFFLQGTGVRKDLEVAYVLFTESAAKGWARSEGNLGFMYRQGLHVAKDAAKAFQWFQCSAEKGDELSQVALGEMLEKGEGVPRNSSLAASWYEKAIRGGSHFARMALGRMLAFGTGIPQDRERAERLFLEALEGGERYACLDLAMLNLTDPERAPARLEAGQEWLRKAREGGFTKEARLLSLGLFGAYTGMEDQNREIEDLRTEAANGSIEVQYRLATRLLTRSKPGDVREAARLLELGATQGFAPALLQWGICLQLGRGVPRNGKHALECIQRAADLGYLDAQAYLGGLYATGSLVKKDKAASRRWLEKAAESGNSAALTLLGKSVAAPRFPLVESQPQKDRHLRTTVSVSKTP